MAAPTVPASWPVERDLIRNEVDRAGLAFRGVLLTALLLALLILGALLVQMLADGLGVLTDRFGAFLSSSIDLSDIDDAGIWPGIKGTLILGAMVVVVGFPLGILAALYIEEYARDTWLNRLAQVNIRNLAGVPSIVYGILGFSVFVRALSGPQNTGGITGGSSFISAGLTLAVLVLPIVIIASQEALRSLPTGLREGALALGATRWETIRSTVLPAAAPGILTGTVLALARALGEAAPLLMLGVATGFFSTGNLDAWGQLHDGPFTALPIVIFNYARQPGGYASVAAAASIVLLVIVFLMNGVAIWLRNRYDQRW